MIRQLASMLKLHQNPRSPSRASATSRAAGAPVAQLSKTRTLRYLPPADASAKRASLSAAWREGRLGVFSGDALDLGEQVGAVDDLVFPWWRI